MTGTILASSMPVIDAETGEELSRGVVPPWCVAVTASRRREFPGGEFGLPCVLVIKRLNEGGTTIVQVTHSETNAAYGHRIVRLEDGWVVKD